MTPMFLVLQEIRDAGTVRPADLLKRTKMDYPALFKVLGELSERGLISIDEKTGAVSPTKAARAGLRHRHPPTDSDALVARMREAVSAAATTLGVGTLAVEDEASPVAPPKRGRPKRKAGADEAHKPPGET